MSKRNVTFHVINSVKGGSGKSTVSLLLAAAHAASYKNLTANAHQLAVQMDNIISGIAGATNATDLIEILSKILNTNFQQTVSLAKVGTLTKAAESISNGITSVPKNPLISSPLLPPVITQKIVKISDKVVRFAENLNDEVCTAASSDFSHFAGEAHDYNLQNPPYDHDKTLANLAEAFAYGVKALLLAAKAVASEAAVYIIDLDLRGTSWEYNYNLFYKEIPGNPIKDVPFINNLMYNMHDTRNPFVELPLSIMTSTIGVYQQCSVNLCRINPDAENNIDELAVDLFEDAIFRVIKTIYTDNSDSGKNVHIILDMPPSYEMHAERILRHLLLDMKSSLQRLADEEYKDVFEPYKVELIMLSALDDAHIGLNANYISRLFKQQSMSSNLNEFIKPNKNRFSLKAWGNDVALVLATPPTVPYKDKITGAFTSFTGFSASHVSIINHFDHSLRIILPLQVWELPLFP